MATTRAAAPTPHTIWMASQEGQDDQGGTAVPTIEPVTRTRPCPLYKVFVHNDPVTSFEFVIKVLRGVFSLAQKDAERVTRAAHERGIAFVCALSLEQAEFRVQQAHSLARTRGYPLTFTYEAE